MKLYTQEQLNRREIILQTHKNFDKFLDVDIINTLINLFDDTPDKFLDKNKKITKYVEDERKMRKLSSSNVKFRSHVFGENNNNSSLIFIIVKDDKDFLHITIHLSLKYLESRDTGMIHIYKDIYEPNVSKKKKSLIYALISVRKTINKPNSLVFSIADGYDTPAIVKDVDLYDEDIQKEMSVIIGVFNKLFDEANEEYYVGLNKNISFIHNKTSNVITNMNQHTEHITRKNRGSKIIPFSNNKTIFEINRRRNNRNRKTRRHKRSNSNIINTLSNVEF